MVAFKQIGLAVLVLFTAVRCLTIQGGVRPVYDSVEKVADRGRFACTIQRTDSTDEVLIEGIREGLVAAGIDCDPSSPRTLRVSVREVGQDNPASLVSGCIGMGTLTLIPAYNGGREITFVAVARLEDGEEHRFRYTTTQTRFSWFGFLFATGGPLSYENSKLREFATDSATHLLSDMHMASSLPPERRFNRIVRLRDGRWFFNVRTAGRADGVDIEFSDHHTIHLTAEEILSVKAVR